MFTGIVEECAQVEIFDRSGPGAFRLAVRGRMSGDGLIIGESIAVDGCCLTVVDFDENRICFDLLEETVRVTRFSELQASDQVNLERSLQYGGRLGGHFVSGHVDTTGTVRTFEKRGEDLWLQISIPEGFGRYLIYKGSVTVNGVSLTVAETDSDLFAVCLIPHTLNVTNLSDLKVGSKVNLEFDLLGKYVEKLLAQQVQPAGNQSCSGSGW